ncbi:UNVERIFIED_CONTAM: hypothetical protein GTU68_054681 [Idotea baltica]|nr:hypothetical protein [Idotea baltica]
MRELILKKRAGNALSTEEIDFFVQGYTENKIADYQVAALLMAIYFKGMNEQETFDITNSTINSGKIIDLSHIPGIKVDKHSTGGVGDKTSLVLGPLVAAAGVKVAKFSGRGLGHTGGTLDKLESIDGFSSDIDIDTFIKNVTELGISIAGQSNDIVPADKKLYALRDVTGTVDSFPLIAASIMGKKIASGADAILLDVKVGSGAFMSDLKDAEELAKILVNIGKKSNKNTIAVLTDMDQPLGNAVGNILEVKEAIDTLNNKGPKDFTELCIELGARMLLLAQKASDINEAKNILSDLLINGEALNIFKKWIKNQGGNLAQIDNPSLFPVAKNELNIYAPKSGYLYKLNALDIGNAASILGAGRITKESDIDLTAGILLHKKIGNKVSANEVIATLYSNSDKNLTKAKEIILTAIKISATPVQSNPLIFSEVK